MPDINNDEPLDISLLDAPQDVVQEPAKKADPPPIPLEYATPSRDKPKIDNMYFLWAMAWFGRKVLFAAGLGIFAAGFGQALLRNTSDAPGTMAVGAMMVGLAIPLSRRGS